MEKTIVIGGGLMGSAAAWQLSQQGEKVFLIEQQQLKYENGSSFGESRIARSLGPDGDIFSYIHNRSVAETKQLISYLNTFGNSQMHSIEDIYTNSPVTYVFDDSGSEEVEALCHKNQPDTYKVTSHAHAHEVFGMTIPKSDTVIREFGTYSGTFNPKILLAKLHTGIKQHNNKILFGHKIVAISRKSAFYEIETIDSCSGDTKTFSTEKLVVAAGPYTGELLKYTAPHFKELITPKRVFSAFFKIKSSIYKAFTNEEKEKIRLSQPTFFQYDGQFYSMIDRIDNDGLPVFKAGGHAIYDSIENLDECWQIQPSEKNIAWTRERMCKYLKTLNISIESSDLIYVHGQSCVYSLTASKTPFVTPAKAYEQNLIVIGGMNGIGGKGCLCYGLIAANLLLGKTENDAMYKKTVEALRVKY